MNILFCLTPKSEVDFTYDDSSLFKTMQVMDEHNYYCIPLISKKGKYLGTITTNDILGCIKENFNLSLKDSADFPIRSVKRLRDYQAVNINTTMDEIVEVALSQNYVPVTDDNNNFIGIVTRKEIISYMRRKYMDISGKDKEV